MGTLRTASMRQRLEQEKGKLKHVRESLSDARQSLDDLQVQEQRLEVVQVLAQKAAKETQDALTWHINDAVSSAINAVFPDDEYQFQMSFVQRRNVTEADILLTDRQGNAIRPKDADGGGLAQVAGFALRVTLWGLLKETRPTFPLDEPFHFLHSRDAHARLSQLLQGISQELGIQIIMVTGEEGEEIIANADAVFEVTKVRGVSRVKRVN